MHEAAKEMVQLAEQGYIQREDSTDPAWQEMLNHATMKVTIVLFLAFSPFQPELLLNHLFENICADLIMKQYFLVEVIFVLDC